MGAWGAGNFDNDAALDWLADLERSGGARHLRHALERISDNDGYIDADEACGALAAAELVAALLGQPLAVLPPPAAEWLKNPGENAGTAARELQPLALVAVNRVRTISELRELWEESKKHTAEWTRALDELEHRLRAALPPD